MHTEARSGARPVLTAQAMLEYASLASCTMWSFNHQRSSFRTLSKKSSLTKSNRKCLPSRMKANKQHRPPLTSVVQILTSFVPHFMALSHGIHHSGRMCMPASIRRSRATIVDRSNGQVNRISRTRKHIRQASEPAVCCSRRVSNGEPRICDRS